MVKFCFLAEYMWHYVALCGMVHLHLEVSRNLPSRHLPHSSTAHCRMWWVYEPNGKCGQSTVRKKNWEIHYIPNVSRLNIVGIVYIHIYISTPIATMVLTPAPPSLLYFFLEVITRSHYSRTGTKPVARFLPPSFPVLLTPCGILLLTGVYCTCSPFWTLRVMTGLLTGSHLQSSSLLLWIRQIMNRIVLQLLTIDSPK